LPSIKTHTHTHTETNVHTMELYYAVAPYALLQVNSTLNSTQVMLTQA